MFSRTKEQAQNLFIGFGPVPLCILDENNWNFLSKCYIYFGN